MLAPGRDLEAVSGLFARCARSRASRRFPLSPEVRHLVNTFIHSRPSLYPTVPPNYNIFTMLLPLLGAGPCVFSVDPRGVGRAWRNEAPTFEEAFDEKLSFVFHNFL